MRSVAIGRSRIRSAWAPALLLALWSLGCPAVAGAQDGPGPQPLSECRVAGIRHSVQCGVVRRALDPSRSDSSRIDVHYIVVPALARRKLPDPVFLLAGGPGQSAIDVAPQLLGVFARLNNRRDIVFVDQRGTGRSAPLECADPSRESLADQADPELQIRQMQDCRNALLELPYIGAPSDLGFYTTTLAMQDLDAVRRQLGAERINLVGVSYGTRAALEYMRQFPTAVRRSVLDAVAPPDMALPATYSIDSQVALDAMFAACERQPQCALAYPQLLADWRALLRSLPKPAAAPHPLSGAIEHFTLTRDLVLNAVRGALYAPATAAALPRAITEAAAGRYQALVGLGSLLASRHSAQVATGMHFSVVCAEDMPQLSSAGDTPGADFGTGQVDLYRRVCAEWPRGAVPPAFYDIPPSAVPTLLLSGGLDPATPPRHAERVARALGPAARHVVVPNAGHGVLAIGCAPDLVYRFIDAANDRDATGIDAGCLQSIPRPGVFLPIRLPEDGPR